MYINDSKHAQHLVSHFCKPFE
uniref:Uncharacterized protein n=1 Tax=Anguilla anguilla TaxID=7936 RepID=A0A0E9RBU5_ANGAN